MENNFEDHIKGAMDNPPDFPFEERLWKDMESRLDNEGKKKSALGFIGKLPLLILALLATGLAGYFYVKQYKAMDRIEDVEQQLQVFQQELQNNLHQVKTQKNIERQVTVVYDTIYNKIVVNQLNHIDEYIASQLRQIHESSNPANFNGTQNYHSPDRFSFDLNRRIISAAPYASDVSILNYVLNKSYTKGNANRILESRNLPGEDNQAVVSGFETPSPSLSTSASPPLNVKPDVNNLPPIEIEKRKHRKKFAYYARKLRPTRFSLSGTAGTFTSLNFGGNGFNLRGSAIAEIGVGERFSWMLGVEYFSNDYNNKVEEEEIEPLKGFPDIPPNNIEDEIERIQGDFNYLQVPVGFKYIVFPQRHLFPYVGAGLIAGRNSKSRLQYDYVSSSTMDIYSVSRGNLLPQAFELSAFWSTLGFEIELNRNWSFLLEGSSQFDLKKGKYKYENLQILKLSTGFQYEF